MSDVEPKTDPSRSRLVLEGVPPPRSWKKRLLFAGLWLALTGATAGALGVGALYYRYADGLPAIPRVDSYWPPIVSEVYTDDAVLAGEFYSERRKVVPYERIPKRLVQAFIASEDSSFFDHAGVDVLGTARAALKTAMKKAGLGGSVQGGSTLTQQTAKAVLVTAELSQLDPDRMMAEAEASVPPAPEPAPDAIRQEYEGLKRERAARLAGVRAAAQAQAPAQMDPAAAKEAARREKEEARREEEALRREAVARLVRRAQAERQEAVKTAFLRVREARTRTAFQKATAKTLERKIREAILAHRLEKALTKEEILYLYLNNVFLGHHSYGVQSAAENYFRKDVRDLTLGEMSLIAGLPQAPSRYSPFRHPDAARRRRTYVLRRMLDEGMISRAEHDAAVAEPVRVYPVEDVFHEFAPYFVEQVRKDLVERYSSYALLHQGLRVFTTMDSERQRAAQEAVLAGLLAVDKRQGYRGPVQQLATEKEREAFLARARSVMGDEPLQPGRLYVGLVTRVDADGTGADVQVGKHPGRLPLLGMRWARKVNPEGYYPGAMLTSVKRAVAVGDVVVLRRVGKKELTDDREQYDRKLAGAIPEEAVLFRLEQEPELQSALVSIDPQRQYLSAMVGGYDFDANEFNRAFQACRQPGSAFKPLVYSAALELLDWTPATVIVDAPIVEHDPENKTSWKPANYSEEFVGDVLLRTALVNSMNIPAVKTFAAVGVHNMAEWSRKLGLSTPMNLDFSAALGSSCVYPVELAQAYATFNRLGRKRPTYFVRKVEDRFGRTLEDHTAYDDAWAPLVDRVAAGYARLNEPAEQVMSPESGFILVDLLRGVVREGTGAAAQRLGKPAAGKTGTTNDSFDAWFAGFTRDLVTVTWVGYDLNVHPLGRFETGGRASLPIWLDYMKRALARRPQPEFHPPESLELVKLPIDVKTGKIAAATSRSAREMYFKKGSAPTEATPEPGQVDQTDFLMGAQ